MKFWFDDSPALICFHGKYLSVLQLLKVCGRENNVLIYKTNSKKMFYLVMEKQFLFQELLTKILELNVHHQLQM